MPIDLKQLVLRHQVDRGSTYHTWFMGATRETAFHTIPRGVAVVVEAIKNGSFGDDFKKSPLESVLACVTEQKEVFDGAAHAFYLKPKLGIPDIYENQENKAAFGRFLENCLACSSAEEIVEEIKALDSRCVKGLGPAVANILYFLHPTYMPPCNTAILKGFDSVFNEKSKLGSWSVYLHMRETILQANQELQPTLPSDLGAISALLYDVGKGNLTS